MTVMKWRKRGWMEEVDEEIFVYSKYVVVVVVMH